jgi:hypothetical protein
MTMQSHAQRVHPANPAEVIANVAYQVLSFHQSRRYNPAHASLRTALPGKCCQHTLPTHPALPNNRARDH